MVGDEKSFFLLIDFIEKSLNLSDSEVWFQGFPEAGRRSLVGAHLSEQRVHCFPEKTLQ